MGLFTNLYQVIVDLIQSIYNIFWADLVTVPLSGGGELGLSLMVLILVPAAVFFAIRTRFMSIRLLPEMARLSVEKNQNSEKGAISGFQTLIVSTATRVGMGNMAGVVAAVSVGGAGAVFWMWLMAILGAAMAYVEATLAQMYKEKDPLYGGYRGGPAQYIHAFFTKGKDKRYHLIAVLFAISGLICWGGISQVIGNSVSEAFYNAFHIPTIVSTSVLVVLAAIVVLRKNATVKVLDILVPIMAVIYFVASIVIIVMNLDLVPGVFARIFQEAFGLRQVVGGGFGAVLMNGVKRGLFSNEAGSGSAPCAAAAADVDHPAKAGLFQALGVLIDTVVICTCTAMIMLLAPADLLEGLGGMTLLQTAMNHHFGFVGVVFIAITLWLFCFSTFLGILFYARPNLAYLFGDSWKAQTIYKIFALVMLFIGGLATYTFVWQLGDIGIALMTVFNMMAIIPMSGQAIKCLEDYCALRKKYKKDEK